VVQHPYVPFAAPHFDEREAAAITGVLSRGWISTGPEARAFETEMAELTCRRYAIALNSGTAALHLACKGIGIGPDDEVIVPTVTFTATAAAVVHAGGHPVLVDVDRRTMNISAEAVSAAITPRTRAVVAVHFAGRVADMTALAQCVAAWDIPLIEDAAHTLPAYRGGRIAGSLGHAAAFSFFATKPITTGEGGMLVTDDADLEEQARIWSLHGISRHAATRYAPGGSAHYDVTVPGYKYNMSDLQAALGRVQLDKRTELWERRRAVARIYYRELADVPHLELPADDSADDISSWYLYVVRLRLDELSIDRDAFCKELHQAGVGTSVHFKPLHTYQYYRTEVVPSGSVFPVADSLYPRLVSLPLHARMSEPDAMRVVEVVADVCTRFGR
jgi:dTDP-4-amino-4,6-dideoxygalactose transaminase